MIEVHIVPLTGTLLRNNRYEEQVLPDVLAQINIHSTENVAYVNDVVEGDRFMLVSR